MDRLGDELLAGPRLALDENGRVARLDGAERGEHPRHGGAAAQHALVALQRVDLVRHHARGPVEAVLPAVAVAEVARRARGEGTAQPEAAEGLHGMRLGGRGQDRELGVLARVRRRRPGGEEDAGGARPERGNFRHTRDPGLGVDHDHVDVEAREEYAGLVPPRQSGCCERLQGVCRAHQIGSLIADNENSTIEPLTHRTLDSRHKTSFRRFSRAGIHTS